jgi:hypothetical protein
MLETIKAGNKIEHYKLCFSHASRRGEGCHPPVWESLCQVVLKMWADGRTCSSVFTLYEVGLLNNGTGVKNRVYFQNLTN